MSRLLSAVLFLFVPLSWIFSVSSTPTSTPVAKGDLNASDGDFTNEDDRSLREMAQLRTELLETLRVGLDQLRDELNAKTTITSHVQSPLYIPPQHHHYYYHHHRRSPVYRPVEDITESEDLSTLRELLQDTQSRLRTTELSLQQTQAKLLAVEDRLQTELDEPQATQSRPRSCEDKMLATQERLQSAERKLALVNQTISDTQALRVTIKNQGSTFVRWGRTQCPNNTQLVYTGVSGGSHYEHKGANNRLCLTLEPEFDETALPKTHTFIYGTEYQHVHNHHDHDVPCSVCRAPQSITIIVPGTLTCLPGWLTQYSGHLMAGHHTHEGAGEFLCVDGDPEDLLGGRENKDGALLYYVATSCGSLPCPPYQNAKMVTCVVCSM